MKRRVAVNILFDYEDLKEFEELVGKGNISSEIRTMIKDQIEIRKKEEALLNSDYLGEPPKMVDQYNKSNDFNKCLHLLKNEINCLIKSTDDTVELYHIGRNLREGSNMSYAKRMELIKKGKYKKILN